MAFLCTTMLYVWSHVTSVMIVHTFHILSMYHIFYYAYDIAVEELNFFLWLQNNCCIHAS
jgi:hypothetical protein